MVNTLQGGLPIGMAVVQAPAQNIIIQADPALMSMLLEVRNQLGLVVAEMQEQTRLLRIVNEEAAARMAWDRQQAKIAHDLFGTPLPDQQGQAVIQTAVPGVPVVGAQDTPGTQIPGAPGDDTLTVGVNPPGAQTPTVQPLNPTPQQRTAITEEALADLYKTLENDWYVDDDGHYWIRSKEARMKGEDPRVNDRRATTQEALAINANHSKGKRGRKRG
jgi:hypothetical protein